MTKEVFTMKLMEKLEALTPGQKEKFSSVATEQELDAFINEIGAELTAEERAAAWKYIEAGQPKTEGKAALADEELENVAGGGCGSSKPDYQKMAKKDGRDVQVFKFGQGLIGTRIKGKPDHAPCGCGANTIQESIFAKNCYVSGSHYFSDCKCYACGRTWESIEVFEY
jgi:hypothetical protein